MTTTNSTIGPDTSGTNCMFGRDDTPALASGGHNVDSDGTCGLDDPTDQSRVGPLLGPLDGQRRTRRSPTCPSPARRCWTTSPPACQRLWRRS
ncbi:MAG: hypothetical protein U5R31_09870 [Acidimicrobiia bacterium]|nr:hypothetical protein [Acidimicrobiia bacterium]